MSQADEDYGQHHYVWHAALTHVYRAYSISVGYEGFHGDNLTFFGGGIRRHAFSFQTVGALLQN